MNDGFKVAISKKYGKKDILINVLNGDLTVSRDLDAFLSLVAKEIGNPTLLLTTKQLEKVMLEKAQIVIKDMKQATAQMGRMTKHGK